MIRKKAYLLFVLFLMLVLSQSVYAEADEAVTLAVFYELPADAEVRAEDKNEIVLYRVADIIDGRYLLREGCEAFTLNLQNFDPVNAPVSLGNLADTMQYERVTAILQECRDMVQGFHPDAVMDVQTLEISDSVTSFIARAELPHGLYFGVGPSYSVNHRECTMEPFLVSLSCDCTAPGNTCVTLMAKFNSEDKQEPGGEVPGLETPTPEVPFPVSPEEPMPAGDLPQTGQRWWPVPLMLVSGTGSLLLGLWQCRE